MSAFLYAILRTLGPAGCAALLALAYYEGIPGINRLPYVDQFPIVREFAVGRVELERRAAVAGMVTQAEADALAAVLVQEQAKRAAAEAMATEERNRAAAALRVKQQQADEIERLTEAAKAVPGLSYPTQEDLQWPNTSR